MARRKSRTPQRSKRQRTTFGKPFRVSGRGKLKKGTLVQYKYVNGRRVSTVPAKQKRRSR